MIKISCRSRLRGSRWERRRPWMNIASLVRWTISFDSMIWPLVSRILVFSSFSPSFCICISASVVCSRYLCGITSRALITITWIGSTSVSRCSCSNILLLLFRYIWEKFFTFPLRKSGCEVLRSKHEWEEQTFALLKHAHTAPKQTPFSSIPYEKLILDYEELMRDFKTTIVNSPSMLL